MKSDQENFHVFNQELQSLQRLQHTAGIVKLMDVIEDDVSISLILLPKGKVKLSKIMHK